MDQTPPTLGQQVFFVDSCRVVMPAIVTAIDTTGPYPRANLAVYLPRGYITPRIAVQQAYHDGLRPRVLNRFLITLADLNDADVLMPELTSRIHAKEL